MTGFEPDQDFNVIPEDERIIAALAYAFSPLAPLLILLLEDQREKPFIRTHRYQALVIGIIYMFLTLITLGCGAILWVGLLYFAFRAYQGESFELPFITDFIKKQGWG
jgi:uncharacterized membrane protein